MTAAEAGTLRVLVVENHADTRQGVEIFLRLLGHRVSCAGNLAETLTLAEGERFDVLLSDISLPDGDGWDLPALLGGRGLCPAHAIAMSGLGSPADYQRSRAAGFEMHLIKPFTPEALAEVLGQVTGRKTAATTKPIQPKAWVDTGWRQKMHDGLCQHLVAAAFLQQALVHRLEKMMPPEVGAPETGRLLAEAVTAARQISGLLDDALTESRELMREA